MASCDAHGYFGLFGIGLSVRPHRTLGIHQGIHRDAAAFGNLVVVEIMCAGDFHRTRAEVFVRIFVGDDRDQAALRLWTNRNFAQHANDRRIAFVRWVHSNSAVAKHGFGARGGDGDVIASFAERFVPVFVFFDVFIGGPTGERVFEVPHVAVNFDILDFKIGNGRFKMRVPVHEALAAIDQPVFVHLDENLDHSIVEVAVFTLRGVRRTGHGKGIARPIAGRAKALELFDDGATGFGFPFPDLFKECITAHLGAFRQAVGGEFLLNHQLGGDTRVVLARLP